MRSSSIAAQVSAVVVFVVSVVALVILRLNDIEGTQLMALVGPVVAALFVTGHVSQVTHEQNQSLNKIEKQTNGELDRRIRTGTKAALLELAEDERQGKVSDS